MSERRFYVYEHWRPDTATCFYVGKGACYRAYDLKGRNKHHRNISEKLHGLGMCVEIRLIADAMTESEAFDYERGRIAFWRDAGASLVNLTDGGEGCSGRKVSQQQREKMSAARKGYKPTKEALAKLHEGAARWWTPENKEARAASLRGVKRPPEIVEKIKASSLTTERRRQSAANIAKANEKDTPETRRARLDANPAWREKFTSSQRGLKHNPERIAKRVIAIKESWSRKEASERCISEARKEHLRRINTGKRASAETKAKMSAANKAAAAAHKARRDLWPEERRQEFELDIKNRAARARAALAAKPRNPESSIKTSVTMKKNWDAVRLSWGNLSEDDKARFVNIQKYRSVMSK